MWKKINVKEVKICLPHGNYCNSCLFKRYVSHQIKHTCTLFGGRIERDGANFIRLEVCKNSEVKGMDKR
jgi:hypothetical protein